MSPKLRAVALPPRPPSRSPLTARSLCSRAAAKSSPPARPSPSRATTTTPSAPPTRPPPAPSTLLTNLRVSRKLGERARLTVDVFNLLDRKVNDIEYFYESQLPGEAAPVADRHLHPAEPRTVRVTVEFRFS